MKHKFTHTGSDSRWNVYLCVCGITVLMGHGGTEDNPLEFDITPAFNVPCSGKPEMCICEIPFTGMNGDCAPCADA